MMFKKNRGLVLWVVLIAALLSVSASATPYIVSGKDAYIDDARAYIKITPNVLTDSGWVNISVQSKIFSGDIDIALLMNTSSVNIRDAQLYDPKTTIATKALVCQGDYANFSANKIAYCWKNSSANNITSRATTLLFSHAFESGNIANKTIFWSEYITKDYQELDRFKTRVINYQGMNKAYYTERVPVMSGATYNARFWVDVQPNVDTKYWACFKKTSQTIEEAIGNDTLYCLDPFINTTYQSCYTYTFRDMRGTPTGAVLPITLNITQLISPPSDFGQGRIYNSSCQTPIGVSIPYHNNTNGSNWVSASFNLTWMGNLTNVSYFWNPTGAVEGHQDFFANENYTQNRQSHLENITNTSVFYGQGGTWNNYAVAGCPTATYTKAGAQSKYHSVNFTNLNTIPDGAKSVVIPIAILTSGTDGDGRITGLEYGGKTIFNISAHGSRNIMMRNGEYNLITTDQCGGGDMTFLMWIRIPKEEYVSGSELRFTQITANAEMYGIWIMDSGGIPNASVSLKFGSSPFQERIVEEVLTNETGTNTSAPIQANITINAYDERENTRVYFTYSLANATKTEANTTPGWTYAKTNLVSLVGSITATIDNETSYIVRKYYYNFTNVSYSLNAYLLKSTQGNLITFYIRNIYEQAIPGALCQASRYINNSWSIVEQSTSGSDGSCAMFLDPLTTYNLYFYKEGYNPDFESKQVSDSNQPQVVHLIGPMGVNFTTIFSDVYYSFQPSSNALNKSVNQTISCFVFAPNQNLVFAGLNVSGNRTISLFVNRTTSPFGTNYTIDIDGTKYVNITANCYFQRYKYSSSSPYKDTYNITRVFKIYNMTAEPYSLQEIFKKFGTGGKFYLAIITLIIVLAVMAFVAKFAGGFLAALIGLGVLGIINYYAQWLDWQVYFLICLVVFAIQLLGGRY